MDLFGIINVNKPKGFTSHDVVAKLRKILKIKQIGHTGTLDPMATGVLPVCVGKATKIIQYLESGKAYRASIQLGIKTDTYDLEGQIIEKNPINLNVEEINKYLEEFKGEIIQTPPIYSAVHYKGKRLYEYARQNIEVADIPTRKVFINSIELVNFDSPIVEIDIDCSEGTYIRSIAHDLGEKLGCGACLSGLIRTKAGKFLYENSKTLEEIEDLVCKEDFNAFLINPTKVLPLDMLEVEEELLPKIKNGQISSSDRVFKTDFIQLVNKNTLTCIAKVVDNRVQPVNVFLN